MVTHGDHCWTASLSLTQTLPSPLLRVENTMLPTMIYPILLISLFSVADGLQCNVLNTIQGISTMACPPFVYQCMKFTCENNGMTNVYKGCNDLSNPPISCTNLLTNCMAMNGKGKCHTCTGDLCNAVSSPSLLHLFIPFLLYLIV